MANEELSQSLDRLHQQLTYGPQLDEATLRSLRVLLEEIQIVCSNPEAGALVGDLETERDVDAESNTADKSDSEVETAPLAVVDEERTLNQRLQDVIEDFETRHPQLTATLSQIADRLSDMGI